MGHRRLPFFAKNSLTLALFWVRTLPLPFSFLDYPVFLTVRSGITGNVHPEQIAEFLQHGANKVISKPLTRAKLLEAVLHFC